MAALDKRILEGAISKGLIDKEQALALARRHHKRKEEEGSKAPRIEELGVADGLFTEEQAEDLRGRASDFQEKRTIAGYQLQKMIGRGSMGSVYKAIQLSLQRTVAIKVLSPHLAHDQKYVELFLREARSVAKLNHPNVISGIDVGEADGFRYFVMEFASGLTVQRLLDRGGALDEDRVLMIAIQIGRALQHADDSGLVHRDVKPDNIMVTKDGVAKLCDLGLAKDRPDGGRSLGTPNYISPEQAEGITDVDIRSDLYSLGASLYHMLTGQVVFDGSAKLVMARHLTEPPGSPRAIEPRISAEFEAIVLKLLAKAPADRYQSPADLLKALVALQEKRKSASAAAEEAAKPAAAPASRRKRRRRY